MKLTVAISLLFIFIAIICSGGISTGKGKSQVKLIDVTWEGLLIKTCEVDVQYGTGSSKVETFSVEDKSLCDKLEAINGKDVLVSYRQTHLECLFCNSNDIIDSAEPL